MLLPRHTSKTTATPTEGLEEKVKELHAIVARLEEEKYDWECRLGRQTEEVGIFICLIILTNNAWGFK